MQTVAEAKSLGAPQWYVDMCKQPLGKCAITIKGWRIVGNWKKATCAKGESCLVFVTDGKCSAFNNAYCFSQNSRFSRVCK